MRALSSSKTVTAVPCAMRSCEIALCGGVRRGDAMIARGARPRDLACVYPHRTDAGRGGVSSTRERTGPFNRPLTAPRPLHGSRSASGPPLDARRARQVPRAAHSLTHSAPGRTPPGQHGVDGTDTSGYTMREVLSMQ